MARVVLGVAGAIIGGIYGGPAGAAAGWTIGSAIGSLVDPEVIQGPRLSDTTVQLASYGAVLNKRFGGPIAAGVAIWSSDLVEGGGEAGKGGPVTDNAVYTISCAIAFSDGPVGAIRKIWAGPKLVYDVSEDADGATQAGSAAFAKYMTVYLGTEDQLPDPTIESYEGAGNVEAYRGVGYFVLTDFPVGDYGNQLPQFRIETSDRAAVPITNDSLAPLQIGPWAGAKPEHSLGRTEYSITVGDVTTVSESLAELEAIAAAAGYPAYIGFTNVGGTEDSVFFDATTINDGFGWSKAYLRYQPHPVTSVIDDGSAEPGGEHTCPLLGSPDDGLVYLVKSEARGYLYTLIFMDAEHWHDDPPGSPPYGDVGGGVCFGYPPEGGYFPFYAISEGLVISARRLPALPAQTCEIGDPCVLGIAQIPGNPDFCIDCNGDVTPNFQFTEVTGTFKQLALLNDGGVIVEQWPVGPVLAPSDANYNSEAFWSEAAAAAGIEGVYGEDFPTLVTVAAAAQGEYLSVEPGSVLVSDIVTAICTSCGMAEDEFDASQLTDVIAGYGVARQTPGRSIIEQLRIIGPFDSVESWALRFVRRGGTPVPAIDAKYLGAATSPEGDLPLRRIDSDESALPAVGNLSYADESTDGQYAVQSERRTACGSTQELTTELAAKLSSAQAALICHVMLYDPWVRRRKTTFVTTRAYTHYEVTDLIPLSVDGFDYLLLAEEKVEDGPLIRWVASDEDTSRYAPDVTASAPAGGGSSVRFDGPMKTVPMDLPLLRSVDDGPSFIAAFGGYRPTFRGGRMYRSLDGTDYVSLKDVTASAAMGYATNALGAWAGGNVVDETSELTVRMHNGEPTTITRDALLGGGNPCAIGAHGRWEILQFQRAELIDTSTYKLTGLLRGRKGTERHMGSHEIGDTFVMFDAAGIYLIDQANSDIDLPVLLKGVAFGTSLVDATAIPFTYEGENLRPRSVVNIHAERRPDTGAVRITFDRCTRYECSLTSAGYIAPLGEAAEVYELDIYADDTRATVLRTLTAITPQFDYTLAQQSDDFGSIPDALTVSIYQISATIGRGFEAQAQIGGAGGLPALPAPARRAHLIDSPPTAVTSYIDTRVSGAVLYKGMPGGEPNAFLLSDAAGAPFSLNTSSGGWLTSGGSVNTVTVTETGVTYSTAYGSNWYSGALSVMVFLRGAGIFELVRWTGDGTGARDIPHTLGVAPALALAKENAGTDWWMYSEEMGANYAARFPSDSGHAFASDTGAFPALSDGSDLKVGTDLNASGQQYLALLFAGSSASVESATYTGNGSSSGPSVSLGFEPALLLIRSLGATAAHTLTTTSALDGQALRHWHLDDRGVAASTESRVALTADGFDIVSDHVGVNENGTTYHYWALRP